MAASGDGKDKVEGKLNLYQVVSARANSTELNAGGIGGSLEIRKPQTMLIRARTENDVYVHLVRNRIMFELRYTLDPNFGSDSYYEDKSWSEPQKTLRDQLLKEYETFDNQGKHWDKQTDHTYGKQFVQSLTAKQSKSCWEWFQNETHEELGDVRRGFVQQVDESQIPTLL